MSAVWFLSGIYMATFAASSLFFLKLYRQSGHKFFGYFSVTCGLISFERVALLFIDDRTFVSENNFSEAHSWVYLIRLCAYLVLLIAIIQKNRRPTR